VLILQSLLKTVVERASLVPRGSGLSGLTAPARALAVAALAHEEGRAVVLYVVPTDAALETAVSDVRFFLGTLEGHAGATVDRLVLPLPSLQVDPYRALAPHMKVASARARALLGIATGEARVVVASATALMPKLPPPATLGARAFGLRSGTEIEPRQLADLLVEGGYERQDPVDTHGEFCLRGGILDVYPPGEVWPVRIEFVGDTVESIRRFDPATQRSIETLDHFHVIPITETAVEPAQPANARHRFPNSSVLSYLGSAPAARVVVAEPGDVRAQMERWWEQVTASFEEKAGAGPRAAEALPRPGDLLLTWSDLEPALATAPALVELTVDARDLTSDPRLPTPDPQRPTPDSRPSPSLARDSAASFGDASPERPSAAKAGPTSGGLTPIPCQPTQEFRGRLGDWVAEVKRARDRGDTVVLVAATSGRVERSIELLRDYEVPARGVDLADERTGHGVLVGTGLLSRGFRLPTATLTLYAEADLFDEEPRRAAAQRRRSLAATFLSDLRDLKVGDLIVHVDHGIGTFVGLRQIAAGDAVHEFLELRYHGDDKLFVPVERLDLVQKYTGGARPALDRLGGVSWERAKKKVKKAMRDMAGELLKLYAARKAVPGHAFAADTRWQEEFEDAFEYELTPDQAAAIADIKRDMESPTPMDRLLCGDVGYGKTEVAMRATFKAVMEGKQVALLAPTTVLAFQHLETLRKRFAAFPIRIDMISRFRTKAEQSAALEALAAGRLDVIVGTHRLLSKDVAFRDLGLLIVDEEQRFGVTHKERIKQMRKKVDVLTLSATPIPRTLNMSLVGIRDMSVIETPPKDRLSIQTHVVTFDAPVIARAIRQELQRGGQVFFVHNRVESIYSMANLLQRLVPEARLVVAHGQMSEESLERAMLDFMAHRFDVLLATTIIENGLDIPNANTIVINRADRYGLSQLYQLRGRVGRSDRPAYAYLLIPPEEALSPVARKRLAAIREFSDLGSGFRVAAMDLELRGAGNLLGGEQSGHIDAVGFETYTKLLEETIRELKGEDLDDDVRASVNLKVDFRIGDDYVPDTNQRLAIYRKVAAARSEDELARVVDEVRDRYGPPPVPLLNLADYGRIRVLADRVGVESIDRDGPLVVFRFREKAARVDPMHLIRLVRERADLQLQPPATVKLDTRAVAAPGPGTSVDEGVSRLRRAHQASKSRGTPRGRTGRPSWWTTRARAGEVAPGFSKAEILRPPPEDPRAPGGVLERVTALLQALAAEA
jgi:transcription-repair coupling factor (superfamily II helicase)